MTPTLGSTELPPISDPVVTINGRALSVIYNLMAEFKLSEWGVDPQKAWMTMQPASDDPRRVYYICNLFAAMVAHNYGVGEKAPTAEDWIRIFSTDAAYIELTFQAVAQALGKLVQAKLREQSLKQAPPAKLTIESSASGIN